MTRPTLDDLALTRPAPAPDRGPLDDRFYDLVEARFRRIVRDHPDFATFIGIHTEDHRLASGERDAVLAEIAADRAHLATIEAIDPAELSETARFERDLEIHNLRRDIFDADVQRIWERRSTALDGVGDPLFALFARDFAPLPERLDAISQPARGHAGIPRGIEEPRRRPPGPAVADDRDRDGRRDPDPVRGDRGRRGRRPRRPGAAPAAGRRRPGEDGRRRVPDLARGHARERDRRLGARARALRRARRAARLRRARRRRDPRDRPRAAGDRTPRRASPRPARSTRRSTSGRSSTGSRRTTRPRSRRPSTPIARSWSGRASTSSTTTS